MSKLRVCNRCKGSGWDPKDPGSCNSCDGAGVMYKGDGAPATDEDKDIFFQDLAERTKVFTVFNRNSYL